MLNIHRNNKRAKTSPGQELEIRVQVYKDNMGQGDTLLRVKTQQRTDGDSDNKNTPDNVRDGKQIKLRSPKHNTLG